MRGRSLAIAAALLLASCTVTLFHVVPCDTLYFGAKNQKGEVVVTPAEFQRFVHDDVAPRFPCATWWPASGQWHEESEPSFVLQLIYDGDCTRERELALRELMDAYKRRYDQQSVLRVRTHVGIAR
jgi:hypothetical protein